MPEGIGCRLVCPICGDVRWQVATRNSRAEHLRCLGCGVLHQASKPWGVDLCNVDSQERIKHMVDAYNVSMAFQCELVKKCFPDLLNQKGKWLEVGANLGKFLGYILKYGWSVSGIDISAVACDYAKKNYNLDLFCGTIETYPETGFDVINAFEVLEHVQNPRTFIDAIYSKLNTNGILLLSTPNTDSEAIQKEMFGLWEESYSEIFSIQHVWLFNLPSFAKLISPQFAMLGFQNADLAFCGYNGGMLVVLKKNEFGVKK